MPVEIWCFSGSQRQCGIDSNRACRKSGTKQDCGVAEMIAGLDNRYRSYHEYGIKDVWRIDTAINFRHLFICLDTSAAQHSDHPPHTLTSVGLSPLSSDHHSIHLGAAKNLDPWLLDFDHRYIQPTSSAQAKHYPSSTSRICSGLYNETTPP